MPGHRAGVPPAQKARMFSSTWKRTTVRLWSMMYVWPSPRHRRPHLLMPVAWKGQTTDVGALGASERGLLWGCCSLQGGWASPGALREGRLGCGGRAAPLKVPGGGPPPPQVPLAVTSVSQGKSWWSTCTATAACHSSMSQGPWRERQASWGPHLCADTQAHDCPPCTARLT